MGRHLGVCEVVEAEVPLSAFQVYVCDIGRIERLTWKEEQALGEARDQGERSALTALVNANLRLVVDIASRYAHGNYEILMELIQEGNIGLLFAAEHFDQERGWRFSTFAGWHIRKYIRLYLYSHIHRGFELPAYTGEQVLKLRRAKEQLYKEASDVQSQTRDPSDDELAAYLHWSVGMVREVEHADMVVKSLSYAPWDSLMGEGAYDPTGNLPAIHLVPPLYQEEASSEEGEEPVPQQSIGEQVSQILGDLDTAVQKVLRLRYGLGEVTHAHRVADCARTLSLSAYKVRCYEKIGLTFLRNSPQLRQMLHLGA